MTTEATPQLEQMNIETVIALVRQELGNVTKCQTDASVIKPLDENAAMASYNNSSSNERRRIFKNVLSFLNSVIDMNKFQIDIAVRGFERTLDFLVDGPEGADPANDDEAAA